MSLLNQLFNRGVFAAKCKTCLTLAVSRIKLLQNKRDLQLKHMRKEIAQFLHAGQEPIARIRVEHVIREQNIWAAYEILELFCEFVIARIPILESQKDCPSEMREAIASIIFAAPRCSDIPDLLHVKNLFSSKYGKEFVMAVSELRPDSGVNRAIIEKLSVSAPSPESRLNVLKEIAEEYNVGWDSSKTEAELRKKHEDLLTGSKQICAEALPVTQAWTQQSSATNSVSNGVNSTTSTIRVNPVPESLTSPSNARNVTVYGTGKIEASNKMFTASTAMDESKSETVSQPPLDVLEMARAAIASAERASASARAAAKLANVNYGASKVDGTLLS